MSHFSLHHSVICLLAASLSLAAQEVPKKQIFFPCAWCKDFTIGARGAEKKNENGEGYELWMHVPEMGNKEYRIAATPFPNGKGSTLDASCQPDDGLVSPDAKWVAFSQKYCRGYAVAFVLQRDEKKGFKPLPKLVSEMGWDLFFAQNPDQVSKRGEMDGITDLAESSLCDLVAWEPDSSGVWYSLRGGDRRAAGIYQWYFFWDAKTGKASVPDRVKAINRFAAARWGGGEDLSEDALAAEELHYLFLAVLQERFDHPGREVDRVALERNAHALFHVSPKTDGENASPPLSKPDVRSIIERQRDDLLRASLKTGTAATLDACK
jgi:hypothetical protein